MTKGQHWHHTKWEFFIVVSGRGLIQQRKIGVDEQGNPYPVLNFEVSGEKIEAVHMLRGLHAQHHQPVRDRESGDADVGPTSRSTRMRPDTYFEPVE